MFLAMQKRINSYWSKRAEEFADARYYEFHSSKKDIWLKLIQRYLPDKKVIKALDLGTGAGFFAFLLHTMGTKVTGIDSSQAMIDAAKKSMTRLSLSGIQFLQMDAQNLQFDDASFDFIFSRNVTWTLPQPEKAYAEMVRVLAPGGRLLNFDANYGAAFKQSDALGLTEQQAEYGPSPYKNPARSLDMLKERNTIASCLHISEKSRPIWDIEVLNSLGIKHLTIDTDIQRFFNDPSSKDDGQKHFKNSSALFMVYGEKVH